MGMEILMKRYLLLLSVILGIISSASAQSVFSCSSGFSSTTSAACGVAITTLTGARGPFDVNGATNGSTPALSGSAVNLVTANADHTAMTLEYQTAVNVQAFTTTYSFIPDGQNVSFAIQNANICGQFGCFTGQNWSSGAGCEGGFFQAFIPTNPLT